MGSFNSYSSPKPTYSSPAVIAEASGRHFTDNTFYSSPSSNLNSFKSEIIRYLELSEQIEQMSDQLSKLEEEKKELAEKIAKDPEYTKFSDILSSIKGRSR